MMIIKLKSSVRLSLEGMEFGLFRCERMLIIDLSHLASAGFETSALQNWPSVTPPY
jgi:hypothetical protein